jgi:hypothetical protein
VRARRSGAPIRRSLARSCRAARPGQRPQALGAGAATDLGSPIVCIDRKGGEDGEADTARSLLSLYIPRP